MFPCSSHACWTILIFLSKESEEIPVPLPTQSFALPPKRANESADADVVLPMPISPKHKISKPGSTAIIPYAIACAHSASLIAGPFVKSLVGWSKANSYTRKSESKTLHS